MKGIVSDNVKLYKSVNKESGMAAVMIERAEQSRVAAWPKINQRYCIPTPSESERQQLSPKQQKKSDGRKLQMIKVKLPLPAVRNNID